MAISAIALNATISGSKQIKAGIALDVFDNAHPTRIAERVNAKDQEPAMWINLSVRRCILHCEGRDTGGAGMSDWTSVLTSALDEVEYGIVLLDKDMRAQFINRAYYRMLSLPAPRPGQTYNYAAILDHARKVALWDIPASATGAYVANRMDLVRTGAQPPENIRFRDGRIFKFVCKVLPDGGRMLTYADVSDLVQTAEQLRILATVDDLTKVLNRREFLASFQSEFNRALRYEATPFGDDD
jgi:PAS domain-containing protein